MLIVTTEYVAGKEIVESLGVVKGEMVQSKHVGKDFLAGMKNIVGGELKSYTKMIAEARSVATSRMIEEANSLGADVHKQRNGVNIVGCPCVYAVNDHLFQQLFHINTSVIAVIHIFAPCFQNRGMYHKSCGK